MNGILNRISWFIVLFGIWILLISSFKLDQLIAGGVISLILVLLFVPKKECFSKFIFTPIKILNLILFFLTFLKELFLSNIDMAKRVLSPSLPIKPGIISVKTELKSNIGKLILANAITLTPGTFTIDISEDKLFIHWVDIPDENREDKIKNMVRKFEKYLEVVYG